MKSFLAHLPFLAGAATHFWHARGRHETPPRFDDSASYWERRYAKGLCPVTERLHEHELVTHEMFRPPMQRGDLDAVADAFEKVWENRAELSASRTPTR